MPQPTFYFPSLKDVIHLHEKQLTLFGGTPGIRDIGLLSSALAQAECTIFGQPVYKELHEIAAVYAFHIIKNYPFIDGNKRTGALTATIFLAANNTLPNFPPDALYNLAVNIANSSMSKEEVIHFFKMYLEDM